jgi:hypothetical protein
VPESCVTGSKSPYRYGDRGARVAISRRSVDLAAEDKNDKNQKKGLLPLQKLSGTLLAAMATVCNGLPEAIKSEQSKTKYKNKNFCNNLY